MLDLTGAGWAAVAAAERAGQPYRLTTRQVSTALTGRPWAARARRRRVDGQMRTVARRAARRNRRHPDPGGWTGVMPDLTALPLARLTRVGASPALLAALARALGDPGEVLAGFNSAL